MSVTSVISLEQYFASPTKPASEYIAGELFPKAMLSNLHSDLQFWIAQLLFELFGKPRHRIRTEQNLQLAENVILIPDVCVLTRDSRDPGLAIQESPLLCVEILSPSDGFSFTVRKCKRYLSWGVPFCWILDPQSREAWIVTATGFHLVSGSGRLPVGELSLRHSEVFPPEVA